MRLILVVVVVAALISGISLLIWKLSKAQEKFEKEDEMSGGGQMWKPDKGWFTAVWMSLYALQAVAFVSLAHKHEKTGARWALGLLSAQLLVGWAWMLFMKDDRDASVPSTMVMTTAALASAIVAAKVCPAASVAIVPTVVWLSYATLLSSQKPESKKRPILPGKTWDAQSRESISDQKQQAETANSDCDIGTDTVAWVFRDFVCPALMNGARITPDGDIVRDGKIVEGPPPDLLKGGLSKFWRL
jgi:tryptophan-rich sensory protein